MSDYVKPNLHPKEMSHLDLLSQSLKKTLDGVVNALHVNRWQLAAARNSSKTDIAHSLGVSFEKFQKSVVSVEPWAEAGTLINTLMLADPREAAEALLSKFTLWSPAILVGYQKGQSVYPGDRSYGLPYWNASNTRAFDELCGLAPRTSLPATSRFEPPDPIRLSMSFEELAIRTAEHICQILADRRLAGKYLGARYLNRDVGYLFCASRMLREHGQPIVKEVTHMLEKAGVSKNISLQRHIPVIHAYAGMAGQLSSWCDRVIDNDYERRFDTSLVIAYLAGPRHAKMFANAVAWGREEDIEYVLSWAERWKRTVVPRSTDYMDRCLGLTGHVYSRVPDLGKMVALWSYQIVTSIRVGNIHLNRMKSSLRRLLDNCVQPDLRRTAETTLNTLQFFE